MLTELARVFLVLGATSFGGPAAHVALMHRELVLKRKWLDERAFLDLVGATNLIPGPNSTELAIHIGFLRAGWPGLIVAGACFIVPAVIIVGALAWVYVRVGTVPAMQAVFYGLKPVVIAVVAHALWKLGRTAVRSWWQAALGLASLVAIAAGVNELAVLAGAALLGAASARPTLPAASGVAIPVAAGAATAMSTAYSLTGLAGVFLKAGGLLFGSGYVLLAFLRADLVHRLGWLTESQLLDAVAVGQFTPGPVFTTATFVGYVLGGASGAAVATAAIFLPAFVYVAASGPLLPRLRRSRVAAAVLDAVNVASMAMMAAVTWQLGRASLVDPLTVALALMSAWALTTRINPAWLMAAGAVAGWLAAR